MLEPLIYRWFGLKKMIYYERKKKLLCGTLLKSVSPVKLSGKLFYVLFHSQMFGATSFGLVRGDWLPLWWLSSQTYSKLFQDNFLWVVKHSINKIVEKGH